MCAKVWTLPLLGGGLIGWSLWKLHRGNILLLARTRALASANRELALRSRVSAIGAVTANLLHGLKNPLAALSMYVEERRRSEEAGDDGSGDAGEAVRRMGRMIEESVAILAQEVGGEKFDYSLAEIAEVVKDRCAPRAAGRGVAIATEPVPEGQMDNRSGNLLTLAAVNLVTNAIEASAPGSSVGISWSLREPDAVAVFSVTDSGPGLPDSMREDPFRPVHSSKEGGSGVGLAIAAQLVSQMGGSIRLDATGPKGSVFSITFQLRGWRGVDEVR
ncbi:MAG TPA: HAMP domain-containing sensor histidine kinase [Opitutales bacterium]|nr:HAMP domain-containing sensor histidine kinase [Opitutales bacterium]